MTHFPWTTDMPLARITIQPDQTLAVWVCGITRTIPEDLLHVERLGRLLDYLYDDTGGPYTLEIIGTDGTTNTGTIDLENKPKPPEQATVPLSQWASASTPRRAAQPEPEPEPDHDHTTMVELRAVGFAPGEPVRVAYVVAETTAHPNTGDVQVSLPRHVLEALHTGEVILLGHTSGRMSLHQPLFHR